MAKIVRVGYGSMGQGVGNTDGYLYVVNDNVKAEDIIFPAVKHYKSGRIFGTTGKVLGTEAKQPSFQLVDANGNVIQLQNVSTARELGIGTARGKGGRFVADRSTHDEEGRYIISQREMAIRGGNVQQRAQGEQQVTEGGQKAVETYEGYTKIFHNQ